MLWARRTDDTIIELTDIDPAGRFIAAVAAEWAPVPAGTVLGATWDGTAWVAPPEPEPAPEPDPVPEPPADPPVYRELTPNGLFGLLLTAGGVGIDTITTAQADAALTGIWTLLAQASGIDRDDPVTQACLAKVVATGHLTQAQLDATLAAWPTET